MTNISEITLHKFERFMHETVYNEYDYWTWNGREFVVFRCDKIIERYKVYDLKEIFEKE